MREGRPDLYRLSTLAISPAVISLPPLPEGGVAHARAKNHRKDRHE